MRWAIILFVAMIAPATAAAGDAYSFLNRLVAYEMSGHADLRSQTFLSMLAPRLRTALRTNIAGEDVGLLDYDPICQCQDDDGLRMRVVGLRTKGSVAQAEVVSRSGGSDVQRAGLKLLRTARGWRIVDVSSANEPSLLSALERDNRTGR